MSRFLCIFLFSFSLFLVAVPAAAFAITFDVSVNTTADEFDVVPNATCSLREAVQTFNLVADFGGCAMVAPGAMSIILPAGAYTLTGASGEDLNASGDLDITVLFNVTLQGAGAASTTINGGGIDRVIQVTNAVTLTLDGITILGGKTPTTGLACPTECGGGIYSLGSLAINNSTISGNSSVENNGGVYGLSVTVNNSTISGNSAGINNGGIGSDGALSVTKATISGNSAGKSNGGIYSLGNLVINNSTISGNSAGSSYGVGFSYGSVTIDNSTLSGNLASASFGGLYSVGALTVANSTISGNSGGGLFAWTGGTITNSTIYGNSTPKAGYGVSADAGFITLTNTIVAGNTSGDCFTGTGGFISTGNNIDSDGTCMTLLGAGAKPTDFTSAGFALSALANNGGSTLTHALPTGSPAIDMGPAACGATDQRGVGRPQGALCDIGAFEVEQFSLTTAIGGSGAGTITGGFTTNCPGVCSEDFKANDVVSITATPTAPAIFFGWTGTGSCDGMVTNPCSVTMNVAKTVTALFSAEGLIVTVTGPGTVTDGAAINCPTTACAEPAGAGAVYNLTAMPTGAAVFTGWTVTGGSVGDTCVGATTPCVASIPAPAGGVVYATATFDLHGCTSPTATNYNASATINDGSCVFPAAGGGGGGGGGLDNQPPYFPGGGQWLISPEDKANGNGDTPFVWKILTDLDGDTVTYYLYACSGADFNDCKVIDMVVGNGILNTRFAYGLGISGAALLLIGFGFTHGGRRRLVIFLAAFALTGSASLIACGASGGTSGDGVLVSACTEAGPDSLCREKFNLAPGDYQWKVTGEDGRGGLIESEARSFTVK